MGAGQGEQGGCRRRRGNAVDDRAGRRGDVSAGYTATPSHGHVLAAPGEAAVHTEDGRDAAAVGDPHGARSGGTGGGQGGRRTDLRGRLQDLLVWVPAEEECHRRAGSDPPPGWTPTPIRGGDRHPEVFRHHRPRETDAARGKARIGPQGAQTPAAVAEGGGAGGRPAGGHGPG